MIEAERFNPTVRRINLVFLDSLAQTVGPYGTVGHCGPLEDTASSQKLSRVENMVTTVTPLLQFELLKTISLESRSDTLPLRNAPATSLATLWHF